MRDYIAVFEPKSIDQPDRVRAEAIRRARAAGHFVVDENEVHLENRSTGNSQTFLCALVPVKPRSAAYLRPTTGDLAAIGADWIPTARVVQKRRRGGVYE